MSKYVGMSNHTEGCPKIGGTQTYRGIQTYGECKYMGHVQTYRWASKYMKMSKHMGTSKHTGVSKHMGVFKHKVAFKHTGGASKHMAASKHRGGIPTHRWYPSIWWHLNLWGHMDTPLVWQSMLSLWCLFWMPLIHLDTAICLDTHTQTHRGKPNIWRTSKHTGGVQTCGDVQPYRGVSKDRGHPNIQGHPNIWGVQIYGACPNIQVGIQTYEGVQTYGTSKHTGVSKHMGVFKHKVAFKHTGGASKHMAASKHRGGIPTHRWYPSIWWHLNLWGHMDTPLVWQSMLSLCCLCTGGMQMYGGMWDTSFVWQSILSLCCVCTGGIQTSSKYMGVSKHLSFSSQNHSHLPRLVPTICTKKPSLIHSDSTLWWQPSWILPCWIQTLPSWIQTPCYLLSDSPKNTLPPLWLWLKLIQSDSNSFILTQLDDGSHLEFCHVGFRHLVFFSEIHSKTLSLHSDSDSN